MRPKAHTTLQQVILMAYFIWSTLLVTHYMWVADGDDGSSGLRIVIYITYLGTTAFLIWRYFFAPKKTISPPSANNPIVMEVAKKADNSEALLSVEFLKDLLAISESGKSARAKVLAVSEVGQYIDRHPFLKVRLQVTESGKEPFNMQAYTLVNSRLIPRIGDNCRIRYLANEQKTVLIVRLGKLDTDVI